MNAKISKLDHDARGNLLRLFHSERAILRHARAHVDSGGVEGALARDLVVVVERLGRGRAAQRQDSLEDQLRDLRDLANEHGMYDAADWIERAQ